MHLDMYEPVHSLRRSVALDLIVIALLSAVAGVSGEANAQAARDDQYTHVQQLVTLADGRRLNLYCTGAGSPTVILEGGWATETLYWRKVQPWLSEISRVCSYDRAGYGYSDPGPMPRSASNEERDLDALLRAASINDRVILVAHSLGGLDARLFADRHPGRLVGLVLLDPTIPEGEDPSGGASRRSAPPLRALETCAEAVERGAPTVPNRDVCLNPPAPDLPDAVNEARRTYQMSRAYQESAVSELKSLSISSAEIHQSKRSWRRLPVVIVTAGESGVDPRASDADKARQRASRWAAHETVARLSTRHIHLLLEGASHFIPMEHPEAVVEAVGEVRGMNR